MGTPQVSFFVVKLFFFLSVKVIQLFCHSSFYFYCPLLFGAFFLNEFYKKRVCVCALLSCVPVGGGEEGSTSPLFVCCRVDFKV